MNASDSLQAITLKINGVERNITIEPRVSLLDALRDHLGLTGTKKGCNQGACGACTVLVDGERINSCLALAIQYEGREIITVEGLATAMANCIPCSRPLSSTMAFNAAIARPAKSAPPWHARANSQKAHAKRRYA